MSKFECIYCYTLLKMRSINSNIGLTMKQLSICNDCHVYYRYYEPTDITEIELYSSRGDLIGIYPRSPLIELVSANKLLVLRLGILKFITPTNLDQWIDRLYKLAPIL